jgi:pimeloyl-ACP methyl ester carboxylesterase
MYPAGVPGVTARQLKLRTGITLRVAESGDGDAPPVVLLHGWGASLYMYRFPLDRLARAGYRVIAPDLRGHGLSEKPRTAGSYTLDAYLDDVIALLDALGVSQAALVGQSMGGAIALHMALRARRRVGPLILFSPAGLVRTRFPALGRIVSRRAVWALSRRMPPRWLTRAILRQLVYADRSRVSERDVDEYWAPSRDPAYAIAMHATLREFDWTPVDTAELRGLGDLLIVIGLSDRVIGGLAPCARGIPGATVLCTAGGHGVNEERPDVVTAELERFLAERWPPRG